MHGCQRSMLSMLSICKVHAKISKRKLLTTSCLCCQCYLFTEQLHHICVMSPLVPNQSCVTWLAVPMSESTLGRVHFCEVNNAIFVCLCAMHGLVFKTLWAKLHVGMALGMVMQLPDQDDETSVSRRQLLAKLDVCMGGRVAEELIFGESNITTGMYSCQGIATQSLLGHGGPEAIILNGTCFGVSAGHLGPDGKATQTQVLCVLLSNG